MVRTKKNMLYYRSINKDDQGIAMRIYAGVSFAVEVIVFVVRVYASWFYGMYRFFVPPEPKSVRGEIILITGSGHGMGREMALQFAALGGIVVCVDINASTNKDTVELIKENKGKAYGYQCDVTDRSAISELGDRIRKEVGEVDILVNNAGIMPCKPFLEQDEREIRATFEINVMSHLWLLQMFLPSMMKRNHGHIVALSSMAGLVGLRNLVPYCGTKSAVKGIMEALHEELREDKVTDYSGIKFTTVYPYIVDTGLCKNPKIKFPSFMKIVSPRDAAESIIDAVRREYTDASIPRFLFYTNNHCRIYPREVATHIKDFLDSGLEAH
ncbi:short-chain dehydrogenase/reductase family 16C member 6-like isoform X2 [Aricia agestis]|uniref:short-chain dehydrogenase/reductase family 16C member 6-like isoform X2 n=1 Tax=Aricia agestis TaxID=91739 RepID=UPI001C2076AB|nr:short-chain dehydrogenase/reductase family 16C member 6-like isoform X2 [Aricia agestis]